MSSENSIWREMRQRCQNPRHPKYEYYGGRGIYVVDRWQSFEAFLLDMGFRPSTKHTLDRIDNDGPYGPENCRWATRKEQANNRRSNTWYEFKGEQLTLAQLSERVGINARLLLSRFENGFTFERAISEPVYNTGPKKR